MTTMRTPDQQSGPGSGAPRGRGPGRGRGRTGLAGLRVRLTAGGYVLAILALVVGAVSLPPAAPGRATSAYVAGSAVIAILLVGGLVLHELAHAFVARRHGAQVDQISVGLFGGTAHGQYELPGPRGQWRAAAAGPVASVTLAALAGGGAALLAALGGDRLGVIVLASGAMVNAVFGILSLLPGAGPDGGRILRALTWARTGDPARAGLVAARAGQVTGVALIAGGAAAIALGYVAGLWVGLIGILAYMTSRSQARRQAAAAALAGLRVRDLVPAGGPVQTAQSWQRVEEFVAEHGGGSAHSNGTLGPAIPLIDFDGRPGGLLTLAQLAAVRADRRDSLRLREVGTPLEHVVTTTADEPLTSLMERLSGWPRVPAAAFTAGHALVLGPDGQVAGVLTPADLARASQLGALRRHAAAGAASGQPR